MSTCYNLVPRSLFAGFGSGRPASIAREKRPWDEVVFAMQIMNRQLRIGGGGGGGGGVHDQYLGIGESLTVF